MTLYDSICDNFDRNAIEGYTEMCAKDPAAKKEMTTLAQKQGMSLDDLITLWGKKSVGLAQIFLDAAYDIGANATISYSTLDKVGESFVNYMEPEINDGPNPMAYDKDLLRKFTKKQIGFYQKLIGTGTNTFDEACRNAFTDGQSYRDDSESTLRASWTFCDDIYVKNPHLKSQDSDDGKGNAEFEATVFDQLDREIKRIFG